MTRVALVLLALAACKGDKRVAARPEMIDVVHALGDRVCACGTDKECARALRDEWDAEKDDVVNHGLIGEQKATFEQELLRMRLCGDGAGLTFWTPEHE